MKDNVSLNESLYAPNRVNFHTNRPKERLLDLLSSVFRHFSLNANVYFGGNLCGSSSLNEETQNHGHLHLLRSGNIVIRCSNGFETTLSEPSVLYFPQPTPHSLVADKTTGADLVCARIHYQDGKRSPLLRALPACLRYELKGSGLLGQSANWIFDEAFQEKSGQRIVLNRLCDIFIINVLRKVLDDGLLNEGMMAGLAHPQLSKMLVELHNTPEKNWSLHTMADMCAMSRSKFTEVFKQVVGQTPADYLTDWRISVAQNLIARHQNMDLVANQVGYENGSALARVFRKKTGQSPKAWLASQHAE